MGLLQKLLSKNAQEEEAKRLVAEADVTVRKYLQTGKYGYKYGHYGPRIKWAPIQVVYDPARKSKHDGLTASNRDVSSASTLNDTVTFYEVPIRPAAEHEVAHVYHQRMIRKLHWNKKCSVPAFLLAGEGVAYGVETRRLPHFSIRIQSQIDPDKPRLTRILVGGGQNTSNHALHIPLDLRTLADTAAFEESCSPQDLHVTGELQAQAAAYAALGIFTLQAQNVSASYGYPLHTSNGVWRTISLEIDPMNAKWRRGKLADLVRADAHSAGCHILSACNALMPHITARL